MENGENFEVDIKLEVKKEDIKTESNTNNSCNICKRTYKTKTVLEQHVQSVHEKIKYPCIQCDHQFTQ